MLPVSTFDILTSGEIIDHMLLISSAYASPPSNMFVLPVSISGLTDREQRFLELRKRQIFRQNRSQGLLFPVP